MVVVPDRSGFPCLSPRFAVVVVVEEEVVEEDRSGFPCFSAGFVVVVVALSAHGCVV